MQLAIGIMLGIMLGLALRPMLNSWLLWSYAREVRREDHVRPHNEYRLEPIDG